MDFFDDAAPLTEAQEGLWYAQRLDPENPIYNTGQYLDIRGTLDVAAFAAAVRQALDESDALAIRVVERDDVPVQLVDQRQRARLTVVDLQDATDPEGRAHEQMRLDMATPRDPANGDRLVAEMLFVLASDRSFWYQRIHHLVIDGYGVALLTKRIVELYSARASRQPAPGAPFRSYAGVLAEDAGYRTSAKRDADRAFWLADAADRGEVVGLEPGDAVTARTFLRESRAFSVCVAPALANLAAAASVAWPDVLVALVAAYLQRHTGGDEVIVGVPSMERLGTAAARVPAMVMNVLPLRVSADDDAPLRTWLKGVAPRLREGRRHGRYRGEQLRRDLGLLGRQRRLYGTLINVLPFEQSVELHGASASMHTLGTGPVDELTVTIRGTSSGKQLCLELDANPNLYSAARLAAHADRLLAFLANAVTAERLIDVPTVTATERQRWVYEVNDTSRPVARTTLTALIEARMQMSPDAEALASEEESITYAQLDVRSAALAQRLAHLGVRRGDIVAVDLPRSMDLVVTLVATLRAGAAYLPLDRAHPPERIAGIIQSARPRIVVNESSLRALRSSPAPMPPAPIEQPSPDDPAYVIYTSGSTGDPKGVVVQHHAIVNRLEWMRVHYAFGPADRILQKTPATFDVSVWEFFLPLLAGATLVIAPPDAHKDPLWLASLIRAHRITTLHFVPSMLAAFLAEPQVAGLRLRRVFCSGEALTATLRDRCHEILETELHNLYGPTEAAVDVTCWDAGKGDRSTPVPIGFPVWNTRMYVLDPRLRPVPPGVTGDLYIAGVQLAREYLGRPDLTADRFVADPFGIQGERMYRTGDVAQWRDDGALMFLGRSDHQVKLRGLRIELGEIEAALRASADLAHAFVMAREDRPGDMQLVAYVVPAAGASVDLDALRGQTRRQLPDYMVPAGFVVLDALPLTRSGKLDRRVLPAPAVGALAPSRPPATPTERRVAAIFADVLGTGDTIGVDEDFFSLGGHSLRAAQVMRRVRDEWPCELRLGVLFANPTIARLAAAIEAAQSAANVSPAAAAHGFDPVLRLVDGGGGAPALFCIHPAGGLSWCYGGLGRAITPRRDVYAVQAAGLDPSRPIPDRLEDLAADYVNRIQQLQPSGPYHLAGWSVGGIIAHAMAVRLQSLGAEVGTLALLDAYPSDRWRAQPEPEAGAALRALLLIAGHDPAVLAGAPLTREGVIAFLRRGRHVLGELSDDALTGVVRVVESNNRLVRRFVHQAFRGSLLYFRAALDHQTDGLDPAQWQPYVTGRIDIHDVPAVHAHLTGAAAVRHIAPLLSARLAG